MAITPKDYKRKTVKVAVPELFDGELELPTFANANSKLLLQLESGSEIEQANALIGLFEKHLPADEAEFITGLPFEELGKVFEAWGKAQDIEGPKAEAK